MNPKKFRQVLKAGSLKLEVKERDLRGWFALTSLVGLIAVLLKGDMQAASVLASLVGMAAGFYFEARRR